jgi:hypothetical protein
MTSRTLTQHLGICVIFTVTEIETNPSISILSGLRPNQLSYSHIFMGLAMKLHFLVNSYGFEKLIGT